MEDDLKKNERRSNKKIEDTPKKKGRRPKNK